MGTRLHVPVDREQRNDRARAARLAVELSRAGHEITLNLHPGTEPVDLMVDRDRDCDIHLRLYVRQKVLATSIGLVIRKAG